MADFALQNPVRKAIFRQYKTGRGHQVIIHFYIVWMILLYYPLLYSLDEVIFLFCDNVMLEVDVVEALK